MTFDVTQFLEIAKKLQFDSAISSKDDATIRTTAGRMYYAAYLATRDTLRSISGDAAYDINHSALITFLEKQKHSAVSKVGEVLRELMKQRKDADYNPDRMLNYRVVGLKLNDAKFVLDSQSKLRALIRRADLPTSQIVP